MNAAWNSGAATDTGMVRDCNEDRYWMDADRGVFLVVDGVGGHAAGELAAQTAVDAIRESLDQVQYPAETDTEQRVRQAISIANNRVFELAQNRDDRKGMACVLTLAVVADDQIIIGHVGDSRLYLVWDGAIRRMTSDHSPVGEEEAAGELTEAEAMSHPRRNEVFRDVGSRQRAAEDAEFIEIRKCRFRPDAAILLCSDGLSDQLTSSQLRDIVERYDGDAARVAQNLVEAANELGGPDNITAMFVAGPEFRGHAGKTRPRVSKATFSTTRRRAPRRVFTGRTAFLAYGILIGMLLWVIARR